MDESVHHHDKLTNAHSGINDLLSHGTSVIENLRGQRQSLKVRSPCSVVG